MEDPKYTVTQRVGGLKSSYSLSAFPKGGLQADQSFILEATFTDEEEPTLPFDISGSTATIYITAYKVKYTAVMLGAGVLSDSGSGTTDTVTFTVAKDQIPDDIASIAQGRTGNGVIYFELEDADTKLTFSQIINITDNNFLLTGDNSASANVILTGDNDLGTVIDTTIATPPVSPNFDDVYIVAAGGTGDWSGEDTNLAAWNGIAWIFRIAEEGNFVYDSTNDGQFVFDGSVWGPLSIADNSVTTAKIVDQAVTETKLADNAVTNIKMADNAIDTAELVDDAVTNAKLADNAVENANMADNSIGTSELIALAVTEAELASNSVTADKILSGSVDTAKLADQAVNAAKLEDGSISDIKLGVVSIGSLDDVDLTGLSANYILKYNGGSGNFEPVVESGGGSGITDIPYAFNTTTTIGGLGTGQIRYNNATPASVTQIFIHKFSNDGIDSNAQILALDNGNILKSKQDSTKLGQFTVNTVNDNLDDTYTLGVTPGTQGALPDNLAEVSLGVYYVTAGAAGLVSFNGRTTPAVTPATGDYNSDNVTNVSTVTGTSVSDALENIAASAGGYPVGRVTGLATTGTVNLDWSLGDTFVIGTMTGDITFTFSNVTQGQEVKIEITSTAGYQLTNPGTVVSSLNGSQFKMDFSNIIFYSATNGATEQLVNYFIDSNPTLSDKNLIIDGQFNHWDNGISHSTSGYGSSTMWKSLVIDMTTPLMERVVIDAEDPNPYGLKVSNSGANLSTGFQQTTQILEVNGIDVRDVNTLTLRIRGSVSGDIYVFYRVTGGGGGAYIGKVVSITNSFQDISFTLDTPISSNLNPSSILNVGVINYIGTSYVLPNITYSGFIEIDNISLSPGENSFSGVWESSQQERDKISYYWNKVRLSHRAKAVAANDFSGSSISIPPMRGSAAAALSTDGSSTETNLASKSANVVYDDSSTNIFFEIESTAAGDVESSQIICELDNRL